MEHGSFITLNGNTYFNIRHYGNRQLVEGGGECSLDGMQTIP